MSPLLRHAGAHIRRLTRRLQVAAGCLLALPALALSPAPLPPPVSIAKPPPVIWPAATVTSNWPQGQAIQLREARVEVEVFGEQAQTRIELRLFNPNARVLEGELQFPLLDGQVVTGFALDIQGRLRDAVPVPKAQGQEIFEDIRRRRVDPGLLEATAGNQYKLRIYPIAAQGERRVSIMVTETLPRQRDTTLLRLPLAFASHIGHLQVQARIHAATRRDTRMQQAPQGTVLSDSPEGLLVQLDKKDWSAPAGPAGWLQLGFRQTARPQILVGESGGKSFFAGQIPFTDEPVRRRDPRHIALVWDASGSASTQSRVLSVLEAYFRTLRQPVTVSLIVMRNRPEPVRTLSVTPGDFAGLAALLRAEPQDGSSNFDELPIPADADTTLMVTDGLMTDGLRQINYRHTAPVLPSTAPPAPTCRACAGWPSAPGVRWWTPPGCHPTKPHRPCSGTAGASSPSPACLPSGWWPRRCASSRAAWPWRVSCVTPRRRSASRWATPAGAPAR
jgi:hypothetical protein